MAGEAQRRVGLKGRFILGFAGLLAGLSVQGLTGLAGDLGLGAAAVAAFIAGLAIVPRSSPNLELVHLRDDYLEKESDETQLTLLDTRLAMHQHSQRVLGQKSALVSAAAAVLGIAVVLVVVGAILG